MVQAALKRESIAKIKFKLFIKNFKKNWALFRESKMGMFGLWVIIAFGIFGALSPIVLNLLDPSIYDPVIGLDNRVLSSKYITDFLSSQNLIKGIEIPAAQLWVYSFMDQGEDFRARMEDLVRNAQYEIMSTYAPDSMRHFLDTIADSYIPTKERMYFQTSISELVDKGVIKVAAITSVRDVGNRDRFSFGDFSRLLENVDYKTLAIAISPYKDTDEFSRVLLWFRGLNRNNSELVAEFEQIASGSYSEEEVKQAEEKVLEVARRIAGESSKGGQVNVSSNTQLMEIIANESVPVSGLVNAAAFTLISDIIVLSKENEELRKALESSRFKDLIAIAESKLSNLDNPEILRPALDKARTSVTNVLKEIGELGFDVKVEDVEKFLEIYSGMELAKISVDIGPEYRAKLEEKLSEISREVRKGYVAQLNNIFLKIAMARTFMASLLGTKDVPGAYETLGSKVIASLSDPVVSLMAYAFAGTNKLQKVINNIEYSQLDDFRRMDIVEKLKNFQEPVEAVRFLIGEGDIDDEIYETLVNEHVKNLSDPSEWNNVKKPSDIEKKQKTAWNKSFAEKKLIEIFNTMSITNKIGIGHPLPPSRWHWLGTDPVGRDVLVQLMVSTPSEFVLGVLAALITVTVGTIIGTASAYYGGVVDAIFMRIADLMMLFPTIAFLIVLSGFMTMNLFKLALILGLLGGFGGITLVLKAQALTVKVKPYIDAARVSGGSHAYIIFNHIIPNVMPLSFLYMMFNVTGAVFSEAVLSFFGLMKVRMSWGLMINTVWSSGYLGSGNIGAYWWLWVPAGGAITVFCSAFYFLGRGLEEIVNPRLRKR
ncbi:ABC transporter permease [Fervidobacterium thailandense]|uniref:ABC transporter permease n=1 Tax=Fervidobacterium thailandense TaxID=1008305 RepID=A0A1E3G3B6_9BACT|nr:ABC transporter permease [Fervidobacterium thailandense]ODN30178.1 ABC transporter permease [Fervidobacterium thailandense]